MDKTQEIMGLVDQFADCVERSVSSGDSPVNYLSKEAESRKAIESALRELVRVPLLREEGDSGYSGEGDRVFWEGVRYAEDAHNIKNVIRAKQWS